jgi:hypothetical protein
MNPIKRIAEPDYLATASYFDHRAEKARHDRDRERFRQVAAKRALGLKKLLSLRQSRRSFR